MVQLKRVADRQHPLRDPELRRVAPRDRGQAAGLNSQEGDVGRFVPSDQVCREFSFIGQRDRDCGGLTTDDVRVCEDVSVLTDDDPGAQTGSLTIAGEILGIAKEVSEERVTRKTRPAANDLQGRDVRDDGNGVLGDAGEVRQLGRLGRRWAALHRGDRRRVVCRRCR